MRTCKSSKDLHFLTTITVTESSLSRTARLPARYLARLPKKCKSPANISHLYFDVSYKPCVFGWNENVFFVQLYQILMKILLSNNYMKWKSQQGSICLSNFLWFVQVLPLLLYACLPATPCMKINRNSNYVVMKLQPFPFLYYSKNILILMYKLINSLFNLRIGSPAFFLYLFVHLN